MGSYTLDHLDRKIAHELKDDARISNAELARRVGLSQSPCWTGVKIWKTGASYPGIRPLLAKKHWAEVK